mgnify:CR=1 FL=1
MEAKLRRLVVIPIAIVALCGLTMALSWTTPGYAGGPEATPTCPSCTGGTNPTPVANTSSIVGYAYDYSTGPPNGHAINPNVLVNTSGMTDTYTVYLGFYVGDQPPLGELKTPDGRSLTGINEVIVTELPASTDGAIIPDVGGVFPDSYLIIGLSAILLLSLPIAGLTALARQYAHH